MRILDGVLGAGVGRSPSSSGSTRGCTASTCGCSRAAWPSTGRSGAQWPPQRARPGAALGRDLHQRIDRGRGHQSARLAGAAADRAAWICSSSCCAGGPNRGACATQAQRGQAHKEGSAMDFSLNDEQQTDRQDHPRLRAERTVSAREGSRGDRRAARRSAPRTEGQGDRCRTVRRQHAGRGRAARDWTPSAGCCTRRNSAAPITRCIGPAWAGPRTSCWPAKASSASATCCRRCAATGPSAWR